MHLELEIQRAFEEADAAAGNEIPGQGGLADGEGAVWFPSRAVAEEERRDGHVASTVQAEFDFSGKGMRQVYLAEYKKEKELREARRLSAILAAAEAAEATGRAPGLTLHGR